MVPRPPCVGELVCGIALFLSYVIWLVTPCLTKTPAGVAHVFVHITDPQLGLLNGHSANPQDWQDERNMLAQLVNMSVELQPKPRFIFIGGDMQNFWPNEKEVDRNFNPSDPNWTTHGTNLGFYQRQDANETLQIARSRGIELYFSAGEHDVGDRPNADTLKTYSESWGPHHEIVLNENGTLVLQLNSELYEIPLLKGRKAKRNKWFDEFGEQLDHVHKDALLSVKKAEQNAWLDEKLKHVTADTKLVVLMTHRPPFMHNMAEAEGWANWRQEDRMEVMDKIISKVKQRIPILWVCGHFHGNVRSASWYKGHAVHVRVTSAAGTTMQWQGRASFSPRRAASIAGKPFDKAFKEDLEGRVASSGNPFSANPSNIKERLQAIESRSGLRIFRSFTDGAFEDQFFTVEELRKRATDSIDELLVPSYYSPFQSYAAGATGSIQVLPPLICLYWYIIPFSAMWLAVVVLKVVHTYRSRRTTEDPIRMVVMELAIHTFPLSVFLNSLLIEWWPNVRILHVISDINLAWYAGLLYGSQIGFRWNAWRQFKAVFRMDATSPSLWSLLFVLMSITWAGLFILVGSASTGRNSDVTSMVIPTIVACFLMMCTDTERDAVCICFLSSFYICGLFTGHMLVIGIARGGDRGGLGATMSVLGVALLIFTRHVNLFVRRGRVLPDWAKSIQFLHFAELVRRRALNPEWRIGRMQELDTALFGNPAHARHIVVVSHPWWDSKDPDPEGEQLGEMLRVIKERLISKYRWRRLFEGPGDVLVFFDYGSLPQWPRSEHEEFVFRRALAHMHTLYQTFDVLVLDRIPEHLQLHGVHLSYYDKGWCWFECRQAWINDRLQALSPHVKLCDEENGVEWEKALRGEPEMDDHWYSFENEEKRKGFIQMREKQQAKAKYFTNGRADFDIVSQLLEVAQKKMQLKEAIEEKSLKKVQDSFTERDDRDCEDSAKPIVYKYSKEDLANEFFDHKLTSALHLAVQARDSEIVALLYEKGAVPACDFSGDLPWEWRGCMIWSDAARKACELASKSDFRRKGGSIVHASTGRTPSAHIFGKETSHASGPSFGSTVRSLSNEDEASVRYRLDNSGVADRPVEPTWSAQRHARGSPNSASGAVAANVVGEASDATYMFGSPSSARPAGGEEAGDRSMLVDTEAQIASRTSLSSRRGRGWSGARPTAEAPPPQNVHGHSTAGMRPRTQE